MHRIPLKRWASHLALATAFAGAITLSYPSEAGLFDRSDMPTALQQHFGGAQPEHRSLYEGAGYQPLWTDDCELSSRGKDAVEALQGAGDHGIDPGRYNLAGIKAQLQQCKGDPAQAQLDATITDSIAKFAQDLKCGAVPSQNADLTCSFTPSEMAQLVRGDTGQGLDRLAPRFAAYGKTQEAYKRYRGMGGQDWPAISGGTLKPGDASPQVATLRRQLQLLGDDVAAEGGAATYDQALVEAVKRFQAGHGLDADGIVGSGTMAALNGASPAARAEQLAATLERMRWLPEMEDRRILVNIPSQQLTAYENGRPVMTMKAIVGQPSRKTPLFSNHIARVNFNPYWGVPKSIFNADKLGKVRSDPGYLERNRYEVINRKTGQKVSPYSVAWNEGSYGSYMVRQKPGSHNALGKVKFLLPDNDNIYLHDTSQAELFGEDQRLLSSGCVRVEEPVRLAEFVMKNEPGWDASRIREAYDGSKHQWVTLENPVQVDTVYWTAWADADGEHFYNDVYGNNGTLLANLRGIMPQAGTSLADAR